MPHQACRALAQNSEQQAFVIALAETGDGPVAERLVARALNALGHSLPREAEETEARFFLLLISALIDWRWQRSVWVRPFQRLFRPHASAPPVVPAQLRRLPPGRRHAYLLRRLTSLTTRQIANIVELPCAQVRHPVWDACAAPPSAAARSRHRRRLRLLAGELRLLRAALSPARQRLLRQVRERALASPTDAEHRALYLWQQAMQRQILPTGVVMLLLLIWLLGSILYF